MPAKALYAMLFLCPANLCFAELPTQIEAVRQENASACREAGGNPIETEGYIVQLDLNDDPQPDIVMNLMGLTCEGAYSYFCGSGGCPVTVWISGPDGFSVAWSGYAKDIAWENDTMIAYLHGQFCTPPRVGAEGCEERVSFAAPASTMTGLEPGGLAASQPPEPTNAPASDRWQLRNGGGMEVALVGGPGTLRSLAAFCLVDQPWIALMLVPPPGSDDIYVDFTFAGGTIGGPAQRQLTSGGAFMIGLENNPLPRLLAGRDRQVGLAIDGSDLGKISLAGSTDALRTALRTCLQF